MKSGIEQDVDELQLAIVCPAMELVSASASVENGRLLSTTELSAALAAGVYFDGVLTTNAEPEHTQALAQCCEQFDVNLAVFDSPTQDFVAAYDVLVNLADKLFSREIPNNIDFADIRHLSLSCDHLFAFNNKEAALAFLASSHRDKVVGGIYLAHGATGLDEYQATNNALLQHFPDYGYLCASFHSLGRGECTIVLGVKKSS
uniref:hypothetical protein n=1 Tax=Thaumasiovibrio occultus TaxID=1891184 RepID=UPI000B34CD05|nr:hypothetical protein [Thaumasiovibrio occultus]